VADPTPASKGAGTPSSAKGSGAPSEGFPWRLVLFGALAVYGVLLVILNSEQVNVSFVFFDTEASLVVVLLLALAIGFLAGFLFDTLRERRKRKPAASP
jgi:uncharacterized integral membrane protein